ncbi:hypothetical protein ACFY1G_18220 [Streptomyces olivaceus]|uniref:hypothetical protein n=1 Tax=Streptomyces olivaceus TaxID=47716 RepID=UPI001CCCC02C|nr:hypothetical protein [Streptomyces olivaceus]MBZ6192579.1 hypothetical protein [Streptomyces olivaceus]
MLYLIGFAEGACAHVSDLVQDGIHAYAAFPHVFIRVFFVSLVVLDPLVVMLVGLVRRSGVWWGSAVMTLDVAANWISNWASVKGDPMQLLQPVGLTAITLFGLFVLVSCLPLLRVMKNADGPASHIKDLRSRRDATRVE